MLMKQEAQLNRLQATRRAGATHDQREPRDRERDTRDREREADARTRVRERSLSVVDLGLRDKMARLAGGFREEEDDLELDFTPRSDYTSITSTSQDEAASTSTGYTYTMGIR